MRRPSPQICRGCLRPHIRLQSDVRKSRRDLLMRLLQHGPDPPRVYAMQLFDHVTIGVKVEDPDEPDQLHPAPKAPDDWTAAGLALMDRLAIEIAFGLL